MKKDDYKIFGPDHIILPKSKTLEGSGSETREPILKAVKEEILTVSRIYIHK